MAIYFKTFNAKIISFAPIVIINPQYGNPMFKKEQNKHEFIKFILRQKILWITGESFKSFKN